MKRLGLALALALWAGPALAQNVTCSTRPSGDSSNACASTAFVQSAVTGGGSGAGVTSIQGMTGVLSCGTGLTCAGQILSVTGGGIVNSVTNVDGTLTITPTTGAVVASINLAKQNDWTAAQNVIVTTNGTVLNTITNASGGSQAVVGWAVSNGVLTGYLGAASTGFTTVPILAGRMFIYSPVDFVANANGNLIFANNQFEAGRFLGATLGELDLGVAATTPGALKLYGSISGSGIVKAQANAGSTTVLLPTTNGTLAVQASAPLILDPVTGILSCPICGGAGFSLISSSSSITISGTVIVDINVNLAHANAWTATQTFSSASAAALTLSSITGATRCLHVDTNGVVSGTASDCGTSMGGVTGISSPNSTIITGGTTAATVDINLAHSNTWTVAQTFNGLTLSNIVGSAQCLQVNATGTVSGAGAPCGSGSGGVSSITNSDSTLTIAPTTGAVVASLNLAHSNTWTASQNTTINQNAQTQNVISNTDPGTGAVATWSVSNSTTRLDVGITGLNYTAAGPLVTTGRGFVFTSNTDLILATATANVVIIGTSLAERARFTSTGLIVQPGASTSTSTLAVNQDWSATGPGNMLGNFTSYGDSPRFVLRRANGTQAAPTPVKANDALATFGGRGYTSAGVFTAGNSAAMSFVAAEDFTATGQGSFVQFNPSPLGGGATAFLTTISTSGLLVQASPFPVLFADAPLTVNANMVGSPLVGFTDTNLHIIGADGHLSRILMDTFGSNAFGSLLEVRAAGGTATLPTGTPTGTSLLGLIAFGHNGTTFNNNGPAIAMVAAEAFDATHAGAYITFQTTAMGTLGGTQVMRIQPSGGLSVGSTNVGTDLGDGAVSALLLSGQKDCTSDTGGCYSVTASAADRIRMVYTGYNNTTDHGFIQAVHQGVAYQPLDINPHGGRVTINNFAISTGSSFNLPTSAIASGSCTGVLSVADPTIGVNDVIIASFGFDPVGTVGYQPSVNGMLTIIAWAAAGNANFRVCNNTAAAITPGGIFIPWRVVH